MKILAILLTMFTLFLPQAATAQGVGYLAYIEQLNRINHGRPDKNSKHERGADILTDRLLDRKNQVVGEIRDVILSNTGEIEMLDVEFNRLKIGTDRLAVGYEAMQLEPTSNGYRSGFDKDQIVEMFPTLLANITPAAGTQSDVVGLQNLQGAIVRNMDGRQLGEVNDVIFDNLGGTAKYLYVEVNTGFMGARGESVSIPFDGAVFETKGRATQVKISNDLGKALVEYSQD